MKHYRFSITARATSGSLFLIMGLVLLGFALFATNSRSATPAGGTVKATGPAVAWDGDALGTGSASGEGSCVDGVNCDTYALKVGGTASDWSGKRVEVRISWPNSTDDFDLVIHKGTDTSGKIVDTSGNGAGIPEVAHINPATDGVGAYTVHIIYFATVPGDQYHGTASPVPLTPAPPPAATADKGPAIGYENFEAPGILTPVTTTTGSTVEFMGRGAGEPSIGNNWNTGVTSFQSDLETLFITFANKCGTGGANAVWANRRAPTSQVIDSDPIGFTDRQTGRTFAAELTATSPTCKISYTDDDGQTWVPSPGTLGSGIDHETIGGGPYTPPVVGTPAYPNAVYYCSQDLVAAFCLRSDTGGEIWGPPVPTYTTECGGLHGHVKVSPLDGTVYLPNNACGGEGAVVVSEDNGMTWQVRHVENAAVKSTSGDSDPAVGIDAKGRVYFAMANADSATLVATSDDHGSTWKNIVNVSAAFGLHNIRYPAVVAGHAGRAAVAFYGSTTAGSANAATFNGVWHLYVAHTFDGGLTWTTTDATPNAPIQRGCIWTGGGANICRNLLDFFDITIDKQGRVEVGYVNGCPGGDCAQAAPSASGNAYSATATIARQSSGRRLIAASDPPPTATVPGMPSVTQRRVGKVVHLAWSEGDSGGSPITGYQIFRGVAAGGEQTTPLATVAGNQTKYDDTTATDASKTYYYKVVAQNSAGTSCANNEIAAPFRGTPCTGILIHQNLPTHPESTVATANPQLAIDYVAVGEPPATSNFMFKMKVTDLSSVPPNSRWRIVWDSYASPGQQFYVGMNSDVNGATTFTYGTVATAVVGLVVGVPQETEIGAALPSSNFKADGTITIFVPKAAVGHPKPGDLLGAVNGRTFSDNTNVERSTALIDHTFVKAQTDNAYPAATYTAGDNSTCETIVTPTPPPVTPAQLLNISTRADVQTGDKIPIAGFIITGKDPKTVLVRALGPSLNTKGTPVPGRLADPTLELHDAKHTLASNNNWKDTQKDAIAATGLQPPNDLESAIVRSLAPGAYTAVMRGNHDSTGVGLVEAYDLSQKSASVLANISTRGLVETNANVMIAGVIVGPIDRGNPTLVFRGLGPSLSASGVSKPLQDPMIELHDANGAMIASNDDWQTDASASFVVASGLAPSDSRESALYRQVTPAAYTVVLRGKDNTIGAGLVEVYRLP